MAAPTGAAVAVGVGIPNAANAAAAASAGRTGMVRKPWVLPLFWRVLCSCLMIGPCLPGEQQVCTIFRVC